MNISKRYAFFDFDGTLIAKDSFQIFLRKSMINSNVLRILLFLLLLPLGVIWFGLTGTKGLAKSLILWSLTVFKSKKDIVKWVHENLEKDCAIWFKEVEEEIKNLQDSGYRLVLISASPQSFVKYLTEKKFEKNTFEKILGTKLKFSLFGGLWIRGKNCLGREKIERLKEVLPIAELDWDRTYSDHPVDLPILLKSRIPVLTNPKKRHLSKLLKALSAKPKVDIKTWTY